MTRDEALVEADRLEEVGRWEEAAILRLSTGTVHFLAAGDLVAMAGLLRVSVYTGQHRDEVWFWRPGESNWKFLPATDARSVGRAGHCPARVRGMIEEATRRLLAGRLGGQNRGL